MARAVCGGVPVRIFPFAAVALIPAIVLLVACAEARRPDPGSRSIPARVISVTDGDTILVTTPEGTNFIRLLFIDAPESSDNPRLDRILLQNHRRGSRITKREMKDLGRRSTESLRGLIRPGGQVELEMPKIGERDAYGRILAVVWSGGTNANEYQVRTGHAVCYFLSGGDTKLSGRYRQIFTEHEKKARERRIGIWNALK